MQNKTKIKLIKSLFILLLVLVFVIIEAFYLEINRISVSRNVYESTELPESFDNLSLLFFSDLHYGTTINGDNIDIIIDRINDLQPDLVLFGGDLIDGPMVNNLNQNDFEALTMSLKNIYAKYGKYAVLGNHELGSPSRKELATSILSDADFKVLENESIRFHNNTNSSIRIVGVESQLLGNPNLEAAFGDVRPSDFTIFMSHTPDIMQSVNSSLVNLAFSGHSHGHQIYIPFISSHLLPPYATKYSRGVYMIDQSKLHVTNGLGTTRISARLFSNPELVFYHLRVPK